MSAEGPTSSDVLALLRARLWIARLGESDVNRWWRTDGILGPDGAFVGPRVLPKTHPTARARIAFAVARHACSERHPDPDAKSLFRLDPSIEDRLDALLVEMLADTDFWGDAMSQLESLEAGADTASVLTDAGIVTDEDVGAVFRLALGPDNRSIAITPAPDAPATIRSLAAGFVRSSPDCLAVPYLRGA